MRPAFYDDPKYKQKQAEIARKHWKLGSFSSLVKPLETRTCKNLNCSKSFQIKPYLPNKYCSHSCSAILGNTGRTQSEETKKKISMTIGSCPNPLKGVEKVPRILLHCINPICRKQFKILPYLAKTRKYCSVRCNIQVVGRLTTSPKASKGKPGIRADISNDICFYSTWEANISRVFNLLAIKWEYSPKIFNLGEHTYRPDFYLPDENKFIEIKNFMGEYSFKRDRLFRERYPHIKLDVILKEEYKSIESQYKPLIETWE